MLHTMLFMLFACLGFFVAGAAVIPGLTMMVLKNYVGTFAFLATWPALFAIINGFQLWPGQSLHALPVSPLAQSQPAPPVLRPFRRRGYWHPGS